MQRRQSRKLTRQMTMLKSNNDQEKEFYDKHKDLKKKLKPKHL